MSVRRTADIGKIECFKKMARSDEAEWWFNAVYEAVQEIPRGHVTSYGHIARLLGKRKFGLHDECRYLYYLIMLIDILFSTVSSVNMGSSF